MGLADVTLILYSPQGDIREKESLISAVNQHRPDVVFHLASYGMSGREMVSNHNNFEHLRHQQFILIIAEPSEN